MQESQRDIQAFEALRIKYKMTWECQQTISFPSNTKKAMLTWASGHRRMLLSWLGRDE
jgi:hypothetical protein